jgi:hypothetical protein
MARYINDLADVDLGALDISRFGDVRRFGARMNRRPAAQRTASRQVPMRMLVPSTPGVPNNGLREQPLGLGAVAFTNASGTILTLQASPQRPFKGRRLVLDITRTGAGATGLVTVTRLDVGSDNQLAGSGALSSSAFGATAVDVPLDLAPATPGILITVQLAVSVAPGAGERIDVSGTLFGMTIG